MFKNHIMFVLLVCLHIYPANNLDGIKGCLFGGALGDAMGRPTEFIRDVKKIYLYYPEGIRSFKDFKPKDFRENSNGIKIAPYTDDTAMSLVTMRTLLESRENSWDLNTTMNHLATSYVHDMNNHPYGWAAFYRAPGNTCLLNVRKLENKLRQNKLNGNAWNVGTSTQGGCGSVMRAHPFGIIFAHDPQKAALWAAHHSKITHGAPMALAACAAMALGTAYAIQGKNCDYMYKAMIQEAYNYDQETARVMEKAVAYAMTHKEALEKLPIQEQWPTLKKLSEPIYKEFLGWDARTAIAATLYTFVVTHAQSSAQAIFLGVHTPGDSDSIASMAGALVGAKAGFSQLQQEFGKDLEVLEGSQELLELSNKSCLLQNNS